MTCQQTTHSLGAYVLGSLDPAERDEVDQHLLECPACAAELADFEQLPALLSRLTVEDVVAPAVTPSGDLFERISAAAHRTQPRRLAVRNRWLGAIAAAILVIAAGVGVGVHATTHRSSPTFAAGSGQTHMSVTLQGRTSGTDLVVSVDGLPDDEQCTLVAVSRNGTSDTASSWVATYSGTAKVTGSTSIPRGQLAALVLLGTNGEVLVTVPV